MLNGINQLLTGSAEPYDPKFYERLVNCLNKIEEPRLLKSVDAQWQGFLDNADVLGTEEDPWKTCTEKVHPNNSVLIFPQLKSVYSFSNFNFKWLID